MIQVTDATGKVLATAKSPVTLTLTEVPDAPRQYTASISAAPTAIVAGNPVTLTINFSGVDAAWLYQGDVMMRVLDASKVPITIVVNPTANTTYKLYMKVGDTYASRTVDVTVTQPLAYIATISASPATVVAGKPVTLTMAFEHVGGAWLITNDGAPLPLDGSKQPLTMVMTPLTNTVYKLRVKVGDIYVDKPCPVTVTQPPKPAARKIGLGLHCLTSVGAMQKGLANNCDVFTMMNRPDEACAIATGDPRKWYSGCGYPLVFYRIYHETVGWTPADMVAQLAGLTGNPNQNKFNVVITLANEWDINIPGAGSSAEGMSKFIDWTLDVMARLKAMGFTNIAWLTSSMGTPDFTNQALCDIIRTRIAPKWNSGEIMWTDMHLYSPDKTWINKGTGLVAKLMGALKSTRVASALMAKPNGLRAATSLASPRGTDLLAAFNDSPDYQSWYERRWEFLYTRCGFDPNAPGRIISSECGLDEGGIGGFPAHQMDRNAVLAYCTRWLQLQAEPLIVNGVSYPSPFLAGTVYQSGDDGTQKGGWAGFNVEPYLPLIWRLS